MAAGRADAESQFCAQRKFSLPVSAVVACVEMVAPVSAACSITVKGVGSPALLRVYAFRAQPFSIVARFGSRVRTIAQNF